MSVEREFPPLNVNTLKITTAGTVYQDITDFGLAASDIVGKTVKFRAWVVTPSKEAIRLQVSEDSGSIWTSGDFNAGNGEIEKIEVDHTFALPAIGSMRFQFDLDGASAKVIYCYAYIDPLYRQPISYISGIGTGDDKGPNNALGQYPNSVRQAASENAPFGRFLPLGRNNPPRPGRLLRMVGKAPLFEISEGVNFADEYMQISDHQAELLVQVARSHVASEMYGQTRDSFWKDIKAEADIEASLLKGNPGARMTSPPTPLRDGFHFESRSRDDNVVGEAMDNPAQMYIVYDSR